MPARSACRVRVFLEGVATMKAICLYGLAAGASILLAANLSADEPRPAATSARKADAERQHDKHLDRQFAACLILDNQNEIAAAKLAEKRSKSPEVKKFAQMLQE